MYYENTILVTLYGQKWVLLLQDLPLCNNSALLVPSNLTTTLSKEVTRLSTWEVHRTEVWSNNCLGSRASQESTGNWREDRQYGEEDTVVDTGFVAVLTVLKGNPFTRCPETRHRPAGLTALLGGQFSKAGRQKQRQSLGRHIKDQGMWLWVDVLHAALLRHNLAYYNVFWSELSRQIQEDAWGSGEIWPRK